MGGRDVYLNVAGGLRIKEPAADLAVAAALVSSLTDQPLPHRTVVYGEIGLSGEVRPVSHADLRLREGSRLGFERALAPALADGVEAPVTLSEIGRLDELVALFDAGP